MTNDPAATNVALLLDANCIIYYCMRFDEQFEGTPITLYHPLSDLVVQAIGPIISVNRRIGSTSTIISEIYDKGAEKLVDDFLCNSEILSALASLGITKVPPRIIERWQDAFMRKVKKFRYREWFQEISFTPAQDELDEAEVFYKSLAHLPEMNEHIARKGKTCPSEEDLGLAICSKKLQLPLLSNDGDFTKFVDHWNRFGAIINPLT